MTTQTAARDDAGQLVADLAALVLLLVLGLALAAQLLLLAWGTATLALATPRVAAAVNEGVPVPEVERRVKDLGGGLRDARIEQRDGRVLVEITVPTVVPGAPGIRLGTDTAVEVDDDGTS